ncbi:MAG: tetratricopeptide repeat protein [Syntrophomonadaceae bacterium]|jgi:tetratricopeptide (TPR) repeat protein|nr:tetratricopeptide repeat protein [Syntrophomonadaceae bacterium]
MAEYTRIDSLMDFSLQLIRGHKISKAINLLYKVLQEEPRNLQALNLLADCFFKVGQFSQAAETWKMVLKYDKYNNNALEKLKHFDRPSFQYWLKRYNEALKLIANRRYDKAKAILHSLLLEYDGFVKVYELLGLCYWEDSQESMALRLWEKGLQIDQSYALITEYINGLGLNNTLDAADTLTSE